VNRENAPLETPQQWPQIAGPSDTKITVTTMWRDGWLSYKFEVSSSSKPPRIKEWDLEFVDANGFQVFTHTIRSITNVVDKGEIIGFEARGQTLISADKYRRAKTLEISWVD